MKNLSPNPVLLAVQQILPIDRKCPVPLSTAETRSMHRKRSWLIAPIILGLALCVGLGVVFGTLASKSVTESPKVEGVLEDFMSAMAKKDAQTAYALLSNRAKSRFPPSDLEKLLGGANYCLFAGYQDVKVTGLVFNATFNNDPDVPQGVTARVQGAVSYEGNFTGTLNAILEQEGGEWRLINFNVVVPPDKLER